MNIGLIDGDFDLKKKGKLYPNLALMKLSAYHKQKGDKVFWHLQCASYDIVYISKVFTFGEDPLLIKNINAKKIIVGGVFYSLSKKLPEEIEHIRPDYSLYNLYKNKAIINTAYGFTTRGCIRNCSFCVVPKKEGSITENADIEEFWRPEESLILMDNNILASPHGIQQIKKIVNLQIPVDFNQGLDARLVDYKLMQLLCKVKLKNGYLRFAFDHMSQYKSLQNISKWFMGITKRKTTALTAYCLLTNFEDSYERLLKLKELKITPMPQILMNLKTGKRSDNFGLWFLYMWSIRGQTFSIPFEEFVSKRAHFYTGKDVLESKELQNTNKYFVKNKRKYS